MGIERDFDIPFIAELALREKQIQQNYRPIIAVHKWFARRPGTLFRGLILSEFQDKPLREAFYSSNNVGPLNIADPFMGGGIPLIEANRVGCNVVGFDINPISYWIVARELESIDINAYRDASMELMNGLRSSIGHLYQTKCSYCGKEAPVKYFLWVKTHVCSSCGKEYDLFPGALLAQDRRHPKNVFVCHSCGELIETEKRREPGRCPHCGATLEDISPAKNGSSKCPYCGAVDDYSKGLEHPPSHRLFAIEYHCHECRQHHKGRFFKKPDSLDIERYEEASIKLAKMRPKFIPDDDVPAGDETARLHRWGYRKYREMFNDRQLLGLELSCREIAKEKNASIKNALATNLSDLLRYQNMLCRYDTMALKSLDIFSVHGFPVGLVQCESNLFGIRNGSGFLVGSGGWLNIVEKYIKAKEYCDHPFEIEHSNGDKKRIYAKGEFIGNRNGEATARAIDLYCQSATTSTIPEESLDAVFTDPPYFANVQYAELMDFCYVWLRRLVGSAEYAFQSQTTRNQDELTGNITMEKGIEHFTEGLSEVYQRMALALKPGSPLVFTYHHNNLEAYFPVITAILDANLVCSATLPCPAEMGGSIHINGTKSSIIDTIFVCRSTGSFPRKWLADGPEGFADLAKSDISLLKAAGLSPTKGDIRCIIYGHIARLAVWRLRKSWDRSISIEEKLELVKKVVYSFASPDEVMRKLDKEYFNSPSRQRWEPEERRLDVTSRKEVSF
jgi:putative DNA methylase